MKVVAPPKSCPRAVSARAAAQGTGRALGVGRQALQPAPYPRVVAAIDVPELALEIGFLAGDHIVADYKRRHAPQERRCSYSAIVSHDAWMSREAVMTYGNSIILFTLSTPS